MVDKDEDRRERARWKINREISVADLVAVGGAILAALYTYTSLHEQIALVAQANAAAGQVQSAIDKRQDEDNLRYQARIDSQLSELNRKLDRVLERK